MSSRRSHGSARACAIQKTIQVDQGSALVSHDLDLLAYVKGVTLDVCRPGQSTDYGVTIAVRGRFRGGGLNTHWVLKPSDAREKLEEPRSYDNGVRPQMARSDTSLRPRCRTRVAQPAAVKQAGNSTIPPSMEPDRINSTQPLVHQLWPIWTVRVLKRVVAAFKL
jgi:hypothetical protein